MNFAWYLSILQYRIESGDYTFNVFFSHHIDKNFIRLILSAKIILVCLHNVYFTITY